MDIPPEDNQYEADALVNETRHTIQRLGQTLREEHDFPASRGNLASMSSAGNGMDAEPPVDDVMALGAALEQELCSLIRSFSINQRDFVNAREKRDKRMESHYLRTGER